MHFLVSPGRIALDSDRISRFGVAEEAVFGNGGAVQTGNRGNPGEQVQLQAGDRITFVASRGAIDPEENQVFTTVAKFYFAEFGKTADKKPSGDEEHHGNGDLRDH